MPNHPDCPDCRRRERRRASRPRPELLDKVASITRQIRGMARSVAELNEYEGVESLTAVAAMAAEAEATLGSIVTSLRSQGYSWADIGRGLGTTRQAAQQRFGKDQ